MMFISFFQRLQRRSIIVATLVATLVTLSQGFAASSALAQDCPCNFFDSLAAEQWQAAATCATDNQGIYLNEGDYNIAYVAENNGELSCGYFDPNQNTNLAAPLYDQATAQACAEGLLWYMDLMSQAGVAVYGCEQQRGGAAPQQSTRQPGVGRKESTEYTRSPDCVGQCESSPDDILLPPPPQ